MVVYLPVTVVIIKGTLRPVGPWVPDLGIQCVWPIRVNLRQVSWHFLSLHPLHHGFCRNSVWMWGSKGAPCTTGLLVVCLLASGNVGRAVVKRAPEYFWQVLGICLLRWVFFPPSITSTKKIWPPISCSLPAVSLSYLAEAEGHFFFPTRGCTWKALAMLEALQGWEVSVPCWAVAGSSQPVLYERSQGRPAWFSTDSKGPTADPWAVGIFKEVSLNKIHSSCRLVSHP